MFCLSHGQTHIERGFKTNKEFEVENLSENSSYHWMLLLTICDQSVSMLQTRVSIICTISQVEICAVTRAATQC